MPGDEHVETLRPVRQFPEQARGDEGHVAGHADHPLGGSSEDGRVDADRRAHFGQGVVDHRQTQIVEPEGIARDHEHVGEERSELVPHPLEQGLALEGRERLVLAHAGGAAAGQESETHIGAVRPPEQGAPGTYVAHRGA